ncbi:hypothetical protein BMF94_5762 [Rhodotorula taiwanensis]|uniref:Uncharacterized protein n=1 Tax=Rhodotorula taiwanensis TaxID=741276 RepID=A0A2S5B3U2_9BASI|nr:hypothetical protein BMF94_5762 [Rhodotorula taiwanensis]
MADVPPHYPYLDALEGQDGDEGPSLAALMLAERHRQRQRERQAAELEWDEADNAQRRSSLLSAVIDAGPWHASDAWHEFDIDGEESDEMDEELAAILDEAEQATSDDDDGGDPDDFGGSGLDTDEEAAVRQAFRDAARAVPHTAADRQNALAALLQVGSLGTRVAATGDELVHGGDAGDDDFVMRESPGEVVAWAPQIDSGPSTTAVAEVFGHPASARSGATSRQPSPRNEADIQRDLDALLQGRLLGTQPLNFSPRAGRPYVPRPFDAPRTNDPSSALSYTSFLRPGSSFTGEQRFPSPSEASALPDIIVFPNGPSDVDDPLQVDLRRWREAHGLSSGVTRPNTSTSTGGSRLPPWYSRMTGHGDSSGDLSDASPAGAGRSETSPLLGSGRSRASSSRYAPYSSTTSLPSQPQPGLPPALGAAAGATPAPALQLAADGPDRGRRFFASVAASGFMDQWPRRAEPADPVAIGRNGHAETEYAAAGSLANAPAPADDPNRGRNFFAAAAANGFMQRRHQPEEAMETEFARNAPLPAGDPAAVEEPERWGVKVSIDTYDPVQRSLSGFMAANGITVASRTDVPISVHAPTTKSDITTFFTGQILHPILDGLFTTPTSSRVSSSGWSVKPKLTRSHEAEAWAQVGPFKGMKAADLLEKGKDRQWVQEASKGWVLCRWKEKEFINVAAKDAPLSISGHYQIALDRRTGAIEGLYIDPFAAPQQRLILSPANGDSGAVAFGSYSYR